MYELPSLDRWDWTAVAVVVALLVAAYLIYPEPVFQYTVWLVVFTVWMAWFVYYGTKYLYDVEA